MKSVSLIFALLTLPDISSAENLEPALDVSWISHYSNPAWKSEKALLDGFAVQVEQNQKNATASQLLEQFKDTKVFWQQLKVAKQIVALHDTSVLQKLAVWLNNEDRHLRGNAAFILAGLDDERGFEVISTILKDTSYRPEGQGRGWASSDGRYRVAQQISADRYYAVHLLGQLKDARAVPILVPFLRDKEVNYKVAWALGEIADKSAIRPLIDALDDRSSDVRIIAIHALEKLGAKEALPHLRALLGDQEKSHFGARVSVADAAKAAIGVLEAKR